eukprot:m.165478 g.165478  ORF g.165478 m.165478 type:complete len:337 (+) comp17159_c1_seq1:406-1416(+)
MGVATSRGAVPAVHPLVLKLAKKDAAVESAEWVRLLEADIDIPQDRSAMEPLEKELRPLLERFVARPTCTAEIDGLTASVQYMLQQVHMSASIGNSEAGTRFARFAARGLFVLRCVIRFIFDTHPDCVAALALIEGSRPLAEALFPATDYVRDWESDISDSSTGGGGGSGSGSGATRSRAHSSFSSPSHRHHKRKVRRHRPVDGNSLHPVHALQPQQPQQHLLHQQQQLRPHHNSLLRHSSLLRHNSQRQQVGRTACWTFSSRPQRRRAERLRPRPLQPPRLPSQQLHIALARLALARVQAQHCDQTWRLLRQSQQLRLQPCPQQQEQREQLLPQS